MALRVYPSAARRKTGCTLYQLSSPPPSPPPTGTEVLNGEVVISVFTLLMVYLTANGVLTRQIRVSYM